MNAMSIRVITKLPNSEQSYKGKVKSHKYINIMAKRKSIKEQTTIYKTYI
jgi:hypothetical protein